MFFDVGTIWMRWLRVVMTTTLLATMAVVAAPVAGTLVPAGLPTHFALGIGNGRTDWMSGTGIHWDYDNTYLSGGVNTGHGWTTWANGNGSYALQYARRDALHGFIPVFSYYQLFQSNGSCNSCSEARKDLSNLNNVSTMASFYRDFRLLMQRLGSGTYGGVTGFGRTAIVHVEPDLSGYAEQAVLDNAAHCFGFCVAQGNSPADLRASVASSGLGVLSGYPNTYQGFNWALLHLRDLYAPHVLLAFHVSGWATGPDVNGDTSTTMNAATLGKTAGSFAARSGITEANHPVGLSRWNLIFNDVANHDAGNGGRWWDRDNRTFPNFSRWETYIYNVSAVSTRRVVVWQVPMGNQYFDTENDSTGHTQDNRAEYFFAHIGQLVNNGLIGMIFGTGTDGNTSVTDPERDGVKNYPSFCTAAGVSSGVVCDNHLTVWSDNDGGYIRIQAKHYYSLGGYHLS
jgi:hypothetical protein